MPWPWSYNFLFKANFRKWLNVLLPNCTCNFQRRQRKERTQMEISLPVNRDAIRSEKYWVETIYSRLPISHIISWRQKYSECPPSRSAVICLSESADSWGDCPPPGTSYIAYFKLIRHFFFQIQFADDEVKLLWLAGWLVWSLARLRWMSPLPPVSLALVTQVKPTCYLTVKGRWNNFWFNSKDWYWFSREIPW